MTFSCVCVAFLLVCIKKIKYIVIFSLKRIWRRQWNSVESDSIADTFFCFMFNQGFRYVSSCVSCERLASTADIGWEIYLLFFSKHHYMCIRWIFEVICEALYFYPWQSIFFSVSFKDRHDSMNKYKRIG